MYDVIFVDENINMSIVKLEYWVRLMEKNELNLSRAKTEVTRSDKFRNEYVRESQGVPNKKKLT